MEQFEYHLLDKIRLKKCYFIKVIKRDFNKPDGKKIVWSVDDKK